MHTLKKSLGQHFLKDERVVGKIIAALMQHPFKNLLEVGPGGGALTKHLVKIPNIHFKAVELDDEKVNSLLKSFPSLENIDELQSYSMEGVSLVVIKFKHGTNADLSL